MLLEMSIVLTKIVSTERNAKLLPVLQQLRDPFTVVEILEPGSLFTIPFALQKHEKTTKTDRTRFFFAKKDEIVTRQTLVQ